MNAGEKVIVTENCCYGIRKGTKGVVVEHRIGLDPKVALDGGRTDHIPQRFLRKI